MRDRGPPHQGRYPPPTREMGNRPSRHRRGSGSTLRRKVNNSLKSRNPDNPINKVIKYILFFVNCLMCVVTAALLALGIYVFTLKGFPPSWIRALADPAVWLLVSGCLGVIIAFFGCFGPLRENICLISTYRYFASALLLVEIIVIIFIFMLAFAPGVWSNLNMDPADFMKDTITIYKDDADTKDTIDWFQETFDCCGVSNEDENGYLVWNDNPYYNCSDTNESQESCSVPYSCCIIEEGDAINYKCGADALSPNPSPPIEGRINTRGCIKGLEMFFRDNMVAVGGIVIGILIPQIFLICLAMSLRDQINEAKKMRRGGGQHRHH